MSCVVEYNSLFQISGTVENENSRARTFNNKKCWTRLPIFPLPGVQTKDF